MHNDTVAFCFDPDDPFRQFECFVGSCQEKEKKDYQHESDWIPYYMILGPGIVIYAVGLLHLHLVMPKRMLNSYQQKVNNRSASFQDLGEALIKGPPQFRGELYDLQDVIIVHTLTLAGFCLVSFSCLMRWYTNTMIGSMVFLIFIWLFEGVRPIISVVFSEKPLVLNPDIDVSNIYLAFEEPMEKVLIVFICQCLLMWIYIQDIFNEEFLDFSKPMTFLRFFFGMLIQFTYLVLNSDLTNYRYVVDFDICWLLGWTLNSSIRNSCSKITISSEGVDTRQVSISEIRIRTMTSLIVNSLGGMIVRPFIPIQLASSESGIEFILNALATYYILELDDLPNGSTRKYLIGDRDNLEMKEDEISGLLLSEHGAASETGLGAP